MGYGGLEEDLGWGGRCWDMMRHGVTGVLGWSVHRGVYVFFNTEMKSTGRCVHKININGSPRLWLAGNQLSHLAFQTDLKHYTTTELLLMGVCRVTVDVINVIPSPVTASTY